MVGRMPIFEGDEDYAAFQRVIEETLRVARMRICAYCWLPNHWHFVLWPQRDGELSEFIQRMANMHTQRWQRAKGKGGYGHLYQGRFKSFPVESDDSFYRVVRYVERNALRAGLVIESAGAVLDASLDGLLSARRRLEARLLALLSAARADDGASS